MIKAIIFDCFGVLYSQTRADFLENVVEDYESHKDHLRDLGSRADCGLMSEDDYFLAVSKVSDFSAQDIKKGLSTHNLNKKLVEYIKHLRTNYKIGMISNIGRGAFSRYFSGDEQKELFDDVVLSSEVNIIKPDSEIFELAAERLGVDTAECVFVDDIEDNVMSAQSVGMKGIHYQNISQFKEELNKILE